MSLQIRPMEEGELAAFITISKDQYVEQRVQFGGEPRPAAQELADRQFAEFFPGGQPAPGHHVFAALDGSGARVGRLWLCLREDRLGTLVFVYDVEVEQGRRGEGLGRALMEHAQRWALDHAASRIGLNVFGGNTVARALYRSLGYAEEAVSMGKALP